MSKIGQWIIEQEQKGIEVLPEQNNNDAHGDDDTPKQFSNEFKQINENDLELLYGKRT